MTPHGQHRLRRAASWFLAAAARHLRTFFLFTYTDYKTIFFPITLFATVVAPVHSIPHLFRAMSWIWVHLLQCNVSNQYKSAEEDIVNRPWRPIPSGRISETDAAILRICLVPICIFISSFYGMEVVLTSICLTITMIIYDEFRFAGHWMGKNLCNVSGYLIFEIGATKIMGQSSHLDAISVYAIAFSACVIFTTIQAQDFSDIEGDTKLGRVTFPIYAPYFSRFFTLLALVGWSIILGRYWSLGPICLGAFCCLGSFIGLRYYKLRTPDQDRRSYLYFNLWLLISHILPAQARWNVLVF